jgi:hypothetical protein
VAVVEVAGLAEALADLPPAESAVLASAVDAASLAEAVRAGSRPLVLISDGLDAAGLEALAAAVGESGRPCIEVRSERWDGQSPSPLSAACRGVIAGFGVAAAHQAAALLATQ